jgi:hypothetical protein
MNYKMLLKDATTGTPLQTIVDEKGSSTLVSAFSNSMVHITDNVSINVGLTGQCLPIIMFGQLNREWA